MKPHEFLAKLMAARGDNPNSLAKKAGVPQSSLFRILSGTVSSPRHATMNKIAAYYGIPTSMLYMHEIHPAALEAAIKGSSGETPASEACPVEMVPMVRVRISDSEGRELSIEADHRQARAVSADWKGMGVSPLGVAYTVAQDDSMGRRILAGDLVVVDLNDKDPVEGKVYLVWYAGAARLRRIFKTPSGDVLVRADDLSSAPEFTIRRSDSANFVVIGRAVLVIGNKGL